MNAELLRDEALALSREVTDLLTPVPFLVAETSDEGAELREQARELRAQCLRVLEAAYS